MARDAAFAPFEERDHTADLAILVRGRDLSELILNACLGTIALIADVEGLGPEEWVEATVSAPEPERLLVGAVKQLLFEWEMHGGVPVTAEVTALDEAAGQVCARIGFAQPADLEDRLRGLPKAATYHDMSIRRVGDLLETTLVLDV